MGAVASGDVVVRNDDVIEGLGISDREFEGALGRARAELVEREHRLGRAAVPPGFSGRTAIVVDDGVATGATMRAAVAALRVSGPDRVIVALPVAPTDTVAALEAIADDVVCLHQPNPFGAVGGAYQDFSQTSDAEVRRLMHDQRERMTRGGG